MNNTFNVGDKVIYNGKPATVVAMAGPFAGHPCVVVEFRAIFADMEGCAQTDRRSVLESALTVVQ